MSSIDSIIDLGFYGKLPTYGDFIQKRLPKDFINPWHEWLQTGMLACRQRDPEGWMTYYLNCPAWTFVLAGGVCGEQPVAGVTIPSVDRVGRYFNFTMASILPVDTVPAAFASDQAVWLASLEDLALSVLEEEMDQDGIEDAINSLSAELIWPRQLKPAISSGPLHTKILSDEPAGVSELLPHLLHQMMIKDHDRHGLWWHNGSSQVSAQLVTCASMPDEEIYLGLMMDEDLVATPPESNQPPEVDYMDELLSD